MADTSSREKVKALLDKDVSAKDIAEKLNMSVANVYAHKRKIEAESGAPKRGRGRPPKVQTEDENGSKTEAKTEKPKAARPAPGTKKSAPVEASTNGHSGDYPHLIEAIDQDLKEARARVAKLEKMRETLVG